MRRVASRGVYLLHLRILNEVDVKVGKLGIVRFKKGSYVYVGSDQRNVEKRIRRHASRKKKKKWHIDYITSHKDVEVIAAYVYSVSKEFECKIASALLGMGLTAVKKLGSSDCSCISHFFFIDDEIINELIRKISDKIAVKPSFEIKFA